MAIIRWEPFRMEDFPEFRLPRFGSDLAVDVYEKGGNVIAEMNLPGIDPDELDIDVEEDFVRVSGTREEIEESKESDYYYQEIQRGSFERTFRLPAKVDATKAKAEFEDGVLLIIVPMLQVKQPQKLKPTRRVKETPAKSEVKTTKPTIPAGKKIADSKKKVK